MVAFLAALPAIFAAIRGVGDLFDVGKQVVEEVTGQASNATNPQELETEVEALDKDAQARFLERMSTELATYEAITQRLQQQGGSVDRATLEAITPQERAKIALMRMTTRPWAVRWMVIGVVFPPLALIGINICIAFYNVVNGLWADVPQALMLIDTGAVVNELYLSMVGWASGVIMTYMGMREIGKAAGHRDGVDTTSISTPLGTLFRQVRQVFN